MHLTTQPLPFHSFSSSPACHPTRGCDPPGTPPPGKCTGHAFAVCRTAADAAHAFSTLNKAYLGHRYIEIFNAVPQEVDAAAAGVIDYDSAQQHRAVQGPGPRGRPRPAPVQISTTDRSDPNISGSRSPLTGSSSPKSAVSADSKQQQRQQHEQHERERERYVQRERPVVLLRGVPRGVPPKRLAAWLEPAVISGGIQGMHYSLDKAGGM